MTTKTTTPTKSNQISPKDRVKSKSAAPRSYLQQLQIAKNWALNFKLHSFTESNLGPIVISPKTRAAILNYNKAVMLLRKCIEQDTTNTANAYKLAKKKKDVDADS